MRYAVNMPKRAISLTLDEANLLWLRAQATQAKSRSLSDTLDRLITQARTAGLGAPRVVHSVAGTIDLDARDDRLDAARGSVRALFDESLARPLLVMEASPAFAPGSPAFAPGASTPPAASAPAPARRRERATRSRRG